MPKSVPLPDDAAVGVVGAGPAGTFFALHLMANLRAAGRRARIILIDRKAFDSSGPSGCNMCAGAIGPAMVEKMKLLEIPMDERVIRRAADGYVIHGRGVSVTVDPPGNAAIYTVFRGGGPAAPSPRRKSFDQHLLDAAVARGAEFVHDRVESIERIPAGFRIGLSGGTRYEFDFLAGAFGVNTSITRKFGVGYAPPRTWHTVQAELPADNRFIVERLLNRIHIVPADGRSIRFLAITPKDDFLTLTGIGEHVRIADLERERQKNPVLAGLLPEGKMVLCHCHPQVPVGVGRNPFAERMAVVGDAFISRYLKNGIESSFDTSRTLAEAIVRHGVAEADLRRHFYEPCLRQFRYDNVWGRLLFGAYEAVLRKGNLSNAYLRSVNREGAAGGANQARILWSIFAGDIPYREIAREALSPRSLWNLSKNLIGA